VENNYLVFDNPDGRNLTIFFVGPTPKEAADIWGRFIESFPEDSDDIPFEPTSARDQLKAWLDGRKS
jgi:hypothetical protein